MKAVNLLNLAGLLLAGAAATTNAAPPSVWNLGSLPGGTDETDVFGVSPNGLLVAGVSNNGVGDQGGFIYRIGDGLIDLSALPGGPVAGASAVNDNGDFTGGRIVSGFQTEALRGNADGSVTRLGGFVSGGFLGSNGYAISEDGNTVAGVFETLTVSALSGRWVGTTRSTIPFLPGGGSFSLAYGMTPDGSKIVGQSDASEGYLGYVWSSGTGTVALSELNPSVPVAFTGANAISADGIVIVGSSESGTGTIACRWVNGVISALGDIPGGTNFSDALAVNEDGSVIVGRASPTTTAVAAVWINGGAPQRLDTYLQSFGIDTTGWVFQRATGVSANGKTIVGTGLFNGVQSGFRAYTGDPCISDINIDGTSDFGDFLLFFNGFDQTQLWADVNGDGEVDFGDFLDFFNAFDVGC